MKLLQFLPLALLLASPALAVTAPTYTDTAGHIQEAKGTFCVSVSTGLECSGGGGSVPTGTAGSPNASVMSVQGVSGGTTIPVNLSTSLPGGTNFIGAVAITTSAGASGATATTTATSVTTLKGAAGVLYGVGVTNNTTAGFLIALNLASAPSASASITASTILWSIPVAASTGVSQFFPNPIGATTGMQVIFSTSMTTYTVPATLPFALTGYFK